MAFVLTMKASDSTKFIDFLGSGGMGFGGTPWPSELGNCIIDDGGFQVGLPTKREATTPKILGDYPMTREYGNRQVTLVFSIEADTRDKVITSISFINEILNDAWNYWDKRTVGSRVELKHQWDSASAASYLAIMSGDFYLPSNAWSVEQVLQKDADGNYYIRGCKLVLSCLPGIFRNSWADHTLTALFNFYPDNAWDSVSTTHYQFNSSSMPQGDMPAPLVVKVLNQETTGTYKPAKIILGIGSWSDTYDENDYVYEGEDGTASGYTGTSTSADSTMSDGNYRSMSFTTQNFGATISWLGLTGRQLPEGVFRVFARFRSNLPTNIQAQLNLKYTDLNHFIYSDIVEPLNGSTKILDMGTIYNPPNMDPYLYRETKSPIRPSISFRTTDGVSATVELDAVYFVPQDIGYRVIDITQEALANTYGIIDDSIMGVTYTYRNSDSSTGATSFGLYNQLVVPPRKRMAFFVLLVDTSGAMIRYTGTYADKIAVNVYYNPAYLFMASPVGTQS